MGAHAVLSPSAAHRWSHCTACLKLEQTIPDTGSSYAAEGTLAHSLAELCLRKHFDNIPDDEYVRRLGEIRSDPMYSPEMETYVGLYMDAVLGVCYAFLDPPYVVVEKRLDIVMPLISAEYVIFFHDDDIMHPQYAECIVKALEKHPEAELVTSWLWPFHKAEEVVFEDYTTCSYRLYRKKLDFVSYVYASWILSWDKNVFFPGVVYKRDNLIGLQSRFDVMGKIADKPFVLDSIKEGNAIQLEGYFLKYRMHGGQDSATAANGPFPEQIIAHNKYFYDMLKADRQARFNFNLVASEWLRQLYEMGDCGRFMTRSRFSVRAFKEGAIGFYPMLSGIKFIRFVLNRLSLLLRVKIRFFYESYRVTLGN